MKLMANTIIGIITILIGILLILLDKRLARKAFSYKYRDYFNEALYRNMYNVLGIIFIIVGILAVFHLIHFKGT